MPASFFFFFSRYDWDRLGMKNDESLVFSKESNELSWGKKVFFRTHWWTFCNRDCPFDFFAAISWNYLSALQKIQLLVIPALFLLLFKLFIGTWFTLFLYDWSLKFLQRPKLYFEFKLDDKNEAYTSAIGVFLQISKWDKRNTFTVATGVCN